MEERVCLIDIEMFSMAPPRNSSGAVRGVYSVQKLSVERVRRRDDDYFAGRHGSR